MTVALNTLSARSAVAQAAAPQWLKDWQQQGQDDFAALAWPTRKTEAWKYTPLKALLDVTWQKSTESTDEPVCTAITSRATESSYQDCLPSRPGHGSNSGGGGDHQGLKPRPLNYLPALRYPNTHTHTCTQVPAGAPPGSTLTVKVNGRNVAIKVPPGAVAGSPLKLKVPASQPTQHTMQANTVQELGGR